MRETHKPVGKISEVFSITEKELEKVLERIDKELEKCMAVVENMNTTTTDFNIIPLIKSNLKNKTKKEKLDILTGLLIEREFNLFVDFIKKKQLGFENLSKGNYEKFIKKMEDIK